MNVGATVTRILVGVVFVQGLSWSALAQTSGVGSISGTVHDDAGLVIPGVTVVLTNADGTVGGNQEATTDARGVYQFARLVPGSYSVKAALTGFKTTVREQDAVNADVTARVDFTLSVGAISEVITVTSQVQLLDTTTALHQTVMDKEAVQSLPSRNDLWNIAKTVPGLILNKVDVGGTEAYSQSNATVHGAAQANEGAFTIDGFEFGSALNAGASLAMYVAPSSFQEVNYQTGNASAESQRGGLVYNLVTRTGTNQFRGDANFSGSRGGLQAENITDALRRDFLAALPARVLAANPDFTPSGKIRELYDAAFALSGPIVRDKLWFSATVARASLDQLKVGSYNPDGTRYLDRNRKRDATIKISYQMTSKQQLYVYHQENQKIAYNFRANTFSTEAASQQQNPNKKRFEIVKWNDVITNALLVEAGGSWFHGSNTYQPQPGVGEGTLPTFDAVTQVYAGAYAWYAIEPNERMMGIANVTFVRGKHDLKSGYQLMGTYYLNSPYSTSHFPSGLTAIFRNGVPDSVETYNTPVEYASYERNHSFFVQDKWRLSRKITLSLGGRVQRTFGWEPATCQPQTIFIAAQCYNEVRPPSFLTFNPRAAFIYDLFGNGGTAVKVTANRYDIGLGNPFVERISPVQLTNDTRPWTDSNRDQIPQLGELGPSSGYALGNSNRYATDLKRPYAVELSAEVEHQLPGQVKVSVGYYHRDNKQNIGVRNMLVPTTGYIPLNVVESTSGRAVTVYNQDPATRGKFDNLWDNYSELDASFNGIDVNVIKRYSNRWSILGGVSYGHNVGGVFLTSDLNNPNFQFRQGVLATDVPWQAKASGQYELPFQVQLSGSVQYNDGFPERQTVSVGRTTVALTQTTQVIDVAERGVTRLPSVTMVDLSLRRNIRLGGNRSVRPVIDILNVGNINTTTARITQLGPTYGRVGSIVRGRLIRLGFNVDF